MYNMNGPPRGSNVTTEQSSYDIVFKDIIIKSENRNTFVYPNPNNYSVHLNESIEKIYKAELISVNVPAATDITVNLTSKTNRLYFSYGSSPSSTKHGYIKLQAGTYLSPTYISIELQRQFNIVETGIISSYNSNLNRYVFVAPSGYTLKFYPVNGTSIPGYIVQNSIGESLNLYSSPDLNTTKPINVIDNINGNLVVTDASNSEYYGNYNGTETKSDTQFNNSIVSDLVLTNCNIYLSLGKLNSNTIQFITNENPNINPNIPSIFCEIPNNITVSSGSVKTILNQPSVWSSENFYNPPLSDLRKIEIKWYDEIANLININEHCFTLRIYYLQKRNQGTTFSVPMFTYSGTGTLDSMFQNRR
jgi:hypothetical protein